MECWTDLLENLEPDVLGPVRSNGREHESLQLDVAQDHVLVHADAGGSGHLTVAVTGAGEVVETRFQSKLEVGAGRELVTGPSANK